MVKKNDFRYKTVKDFNTGELLKLTLIKMKEYENKEYDLYMVCKVINNELVPLYNETFTQVQIEEFYNKPSYFITDIEE